jgi:alpha-mannosidase
VTASVAGDTVTLASASLRAVISRAAGFGLTSVIPIVDGVDQDDLVAPGEVANQLVFYQDVGNLYNFGNELATDGLTAVTGTLTVDEVRVCEAGPLRARVEATVAFDDGNGSAASYVVEYALAAGEPFLRMATTGGAPLPTRADVYTPYSVMARFPLASAGRAATVDGVVRGTPYHWHDQLPVAYWSAPTFQATHHFVQPSAAGTALAGFYHRDLPAWAIDGGGAMIACLLRNTPAAYPWPTSPAGRGADGMDLERHRRSYALRVPQGMAGASALLPVFEEAWGYAAPLRAELAGQPSAGVSPQHPVTAALPATFSLAQVTSGNAALTVAKAAQDASGLVLRLYQPSNASQTVTIALAAELGAASLTPITALEQPIQGASAVPVVDGVATVTMDRAIATYAIVKGSNTVRPR